MSAADSELLELAAKAGGIAVVRSRLDDPAVNDFLVRDSARNPHQSLGPWNPLTNGGDALRLAARLRVDVTHNHPADQEAWVCAEPAAGPHGMLPSTMVDVPDEARRLECMCLAITRAAAAIGKAMP